MTIDAAKDQRDRTAGQNSVQMRVGGGTKPPVAAVSMQFRRDGGPESVLKAFEHYFAADKRDMSFFGLRNVDAEAAGEWGSPGKVSTPSRPVAGIARIAGLSVRLLLLGFYRAKAAVRRRRDRAEISDRAFLLGERTEVSVLGVFLYRRLLGWGRRARPACIIAMHFSALPWAARSARRLGVPYIYFEIASPKSRPSSRASRIALRGAARVVAPSNEAADQLVLREGATPRPEVLPWPVLGIDPVPPDPGSESRICVFGSLGRHSHEKRMGDPIRAAALLRREGKRVRLLVSGDGPLFTQAEELVFDSGLGDDVELVRYTPEATDFFARIDVFVSPSESEGMSVAMIEAMAAGLPVVSTAVGGALDIVSPENGALYRPGDVETLAVEMSRLASDPKLRKAMGKRSREIYETYLDPGRIGERLVRMVDEVAGWGG